MAWSGTAHSPPQELTRDQVIGKWNEAQKALEAAKAEESKWRKLLFATAFPKPKPGTNNLELNNDWKLTAQYPVSVSLYVPDSFVPSDGTSVTTLDVADHITEKLRRASNEGPLIAERLFKWSVTISKTEYGQLPANLKAIVDDFVETKPGQPQMKLVPPKGS